MSACLEKYGVNGKPAAVHFSEELFKARPPWLGGTRCPRSMSLPTGPRMQREGAGFYEALERQLVLASLDALPMR